MKILFLSAYFPPETIGGGEISTFYLAKGLIGLGHKVEVLTYGEKEERIEHQGIPIIKVNTQLRAKPLFEKQTFQKIADKIKSYLERYDAIHCHDFRSALAVSELNLPKTIVTVRDYAQICGTTNNMHYDGKICPGCTWGNVLFRCSRVVEAKIPRKFFRIWQYKYNLGFRKNAFQKFAHQVFISQNLKEEISKRQKLQAASVIYNPAPPEYLEASLDLSEKKKILYAGTVEKYKGVFILLEAFAKLNAQSWKLLIAGKGADLESLKEYAKKIGVRERVQFLGKISFEKMFGIYQDCDIVVHPALWREPFGRTIIEGMALGKVVVASASGGPKETIQDGKSGFLVEPGNSEALKEKLIYLMKNKDVRDRISARAKKYCQGHFHPEIIAKQYEKIYQML